MCDGPMKYLAVDADGFPINPKESTDVVGVCCSDDRMTCLVSLELFLYRNYIPGPHILSPK